MICAVDWPPCVRLKKATCFLPGAPSEIVQATMRPSCGTVMVPAVPATRDWKPVVWLMA